MAHAELDALDAGRILITTEFREKEVVKLIPGAKWDSEARTWWVPISWAACVQLRGVFGVNLTVGPNLNDWSVNDNLFRRTPALALRTADDAEDYGFFSRLMPFQRAGAKFLVTAGQALLADEMGLGKTVQAITALEVLGDGALPALVVCPNSMKFSWEEELARWAPSRKPVVITGTPAKRRKAIELLKTGEADVGIINYEALRYHTRLSGYGKLKLTDAEKEPKELNEIQFATVLADEAHRLKDPRAKQTRALWWVGKSATYRFALTGTPVANSPEDLWTLMRFLAPAEFPAKTKFIDRYGLKSYNVFGYEQLVGIIGETKDELFRIVDPRFMRRTKAAVLPQLPPKVYTRRLCEMGTTQAKAYKQMAKEQYAELESGVLLATDPLTKLTRLLQFASASGELVDTTELDDDGQPKQKLVLTDPSCKVDALEEIVAELGDTSAVVFAQSKQLINLCQKRMEKLAISSALITGDIAPHDRALNVTAFQEGRIKVLLLTLGAGGEGLTLTRASTAVFLQRSWSMVQNLQAEDRIHRIGQTDSCSIIDVVTKDTMEQSVHDSGAFKADMAEEIVRDEETLKAWLGK